MVAHQGTMYYIRPYTKPALVREGQQSLDGAHFLFDWFHLQR